MQKIITEINTIEEIPYMLFYQEGAQNLPLVLINHGFNNDKYEGAHLALKLAGKGFCVITYDLHKHGERYNGFLENITCDADFGYALFNIIKSSYNDLEKIIKHFKSDVRIDLKRIGITGFSMGGILCFYALAHNPTIKVAVPILGSPDFTKQLLYSMEKENESHFNTEKEIKLLQFVKGMNPYQQLVENENRPLLMINASKDEDIPARHSVDFYNTIKHRYDGVISSIEMFVADEFHYVSNDMLDKAVQWFERWL